MKKELTEQERYDLAADVHYVSQIMHLIDSADGGKTEFDWEYYMDRLEEVMEYISPQYAKDYNDSVEEDFWDAMNDPEINALVEESMKDPRAQEFIADLGKIKRGEMTEQELKDKIHTQREQTFSDSSAEEIGGLNGMDEELAKQFLEELKATGGDLGEWIDRKSCENESFTGLEIDPEKLKRLNRIIALCLSIKKADKDIRFEVFPVEPDSRHGIVKLIFPIANLWMSRVVLDAISLLYQMADHVHLVAPHLIEDIDDDDEYEEEEPEEPVTPRIIMSFTVADMWKIYGKAPF